MPIAILEASNFALDLLGSEERSKIMVYDDDGTPSGPAVLWLTEVGLSVQSNSWEVILARGHPAVQVSRLSINITPHHLRHTFAVHMLPMLIQHRLRDAALPAGSMEGYRQILGDP
ncbi:hypothetical protein [Bradyrhizobium cosmicum]|uniref:hypothetical protein n=1 Tax=Bradyrhizobium cosmicum TaxID=1404864 RepID=UPI0028EBE3AE|nr:hypothetical protein [Bradyrhizobium cosmicum]